MAFCAMTFPPSLSVAQRSANRARLSALCGQPLD